MTALSGTSITSCAPLTITQPKVNRLAHINPRISCAGLLHTDGLDGIGTLYKSLDEVGDMMSMKTYVCTATRAHYHSLFIGLCDAQRTRARGYYFWTDPDAWSIEITNCYSWRDKLCLFISFVPLLSKLSEIFYMKRKR